MTIKEVQKIAQKVLALGLDILLFAWQVVRRVILPTRSRKGNLLSSLLTLFVGLLERIVAFEKSILRRPVVFTHKYVKQGLVIAVGLLFLLSSFEWTVGPSTNTLASRLSEVVACAPVTAVARAGRQHRVNFYVVASTGRLVEAPSFIPSLSLAGPPMTGKRWLRLRVFRI